MAGSSHAFSTVAKELLTVVPAGKLSSSPRISETVIVILLHFHFGMCRRLILRHGCLEMIDRSSPMRIFVRMSGGAAASASSEFHLEASRTRASGGRDQIGRAAGRE